MHAGLPLVRFGQPGTRRRDPDACDMPPLRARRQVRLELLCVVLRAGLRDRNQSTFPGQALPVALYEQPLSRAADAFHALLPVVPQQGEEALETAGKQAQLPGLQMGYRQGLLEFLCLVQETVTARAGCRTPVGHGRFEAELSKAASGQKVQMDDSDDGMILLDAADSVESLDVSIAGGSLVAFSCPAPDKETPNEDAVAAIPYGPDAAVLVIADGAGGLPAGRRAARTAVRSLAESLHQSMSDTVTLRSAILDGIEAANQAVMSLATGSATTMTIVAIEGFFARSYQVGDSEAMVVGQRGKIKSQTMAHSPTGFAVEAGFLDKRAALHHEERHLVSNLIGTAEMHIGVGAEVRLRPRDTVLLASDGLTDNIHVHEIVEMIRKGSLPDAVESIASLARRRMVVESKHQPSKPDDLSVILFRKPYQGKKTRKSKPPSG